jgi:hypothetical protein
MDFSGYNNSFPTPAEPIERKTLEGRQEAAWSIRESITSDSL